MQAVPVCGTGALRWTSRNALVTPPPHHHHPPTRPPTHPPHRQCIIDAAGAWTLDADRRAYRAGLALAPNYGPAAVQRALLLELRSRLVAAGIDDLTAPLAVSLRHYKPSGPPPAATGTVTSDGGHAVSLFQEVTASAGRDNAGFIQDGASRLAWPALRRALAAAGGHYVEAVLGGDDDNKEAGSMVLTGACSTGKSTVPRAVRKPSLVDFSARCQQDTALKASPQHMPFWCTQVPA